ncbi:glycoside hydrolase family 9 protein [Hymenopellis radicata]|nr:glycoside hydrolase family 9 protein [Hymenopellis radicata]
MRAFFAITSIHLFISNFVSAQLSLPGTPFLPQNVSNTQVSSGFPNPQWSTLLGDLLYFYDAQRSGKLPDSNRVSWRNDSCEDDGQDVNVDLSGGYYDAGGTVSSFTIMSICWGATDFGQGYNLANQTAYLDSALRCGLDWLVKAHHSDNTLFVQVADAEVDNAYWGGDQDIPTPRPSFQINSTSPGTDVAAGVSAAFSACSNLYANRTFGSAYNSSASLQNTTYAATLLAHADTLYSFAVNASGGQTVYQSSVPAVKDSYASSSYDDELTIAALFLARAKNSPDLFKEATDYHSKFNLANQDSVFNWDSKTPGIAVLFAQLSQSDIQLGGNLSRWQDVAEAYFDKVIAFDGRAEETAGGLLFYDGDSDSASLNPALNSAMLLTRYAPLASNTEKQDSYLQFAQRQLDYALGKNPMSVPYIVGVNPNSPSNPHSAQASGGNDINNIDSSPEKEAYILYGAVVGGPDKKGRFYDIRSDWPQTEVALDYNAPMLTLAAMHVMNDTNDPFYTSLQAGAYDKVRPEGRPCDDAISDGCAGPELSKGGKIAMAVVISVVGLVIVGLILYNIWLAGFAKR